MICPACEVPKGQKQPSMYSARCLDPHRMDVTRPLLSVSNTIAVPAGSPWPASTGTGSADNALPVEVVAMLGDDLFGLPVRPEDSAAPIAMSCSVDA